MIPESVQAMNREIEVHGLHDHITYLGPRHDAQAIMRNCDIGILSSITEGLPVSLLEYGMAQLPVVTTPAGQSAEVIGQGQAGLLVPSGSPQSMAVALDRLLSDPALRQRLGQAFYLRVNSVYGPEPVIERLMRIYDTVLRS